MIGCSQPAGPLEPRSAVLFLQCIQRWLKCIQSSTSQKLAYSSDAADVPEVVYEGGRGPLCMSLGPVQR